MVFGGGFHCNTHRLIFYRINVQQVGFAPRLTVDERQCFQSHGALIGLMQIVKLPARMLKLPNSMQGYSNSGGYSFKKDNPVTESYN